MKFFKVILPLILLFCLNAIDAKNVGRPATQPQPTRATAPAPVVNQPIIQPPVAKQTQTTPKPTTIPQATSSFAKAIPKSYAQALDYIKAQSQPFPIIINNALTKEFINFVKSLNLSPIETEALLQAGVNLYATWTGNNETDKKTLSSFRNTITRNMAEMFAQAKQIIPAQPIVPTQQRKPAISTQPNKPAQQPTRKPIPAPQTVVQKNKAVAQPQISSTYSITNNVVMTLDPRKKETVQTGAGSMVQQALVALYQKAAPVIMTNNVLEIILTLKQRIGDHNLQTLRTMGFQQLFNAAQQLAQASGIPGISNISVILLSTIDFDSNNLNCYFHTSENLALLIPKEYIRANIPKALSLSLNDQAKACGFNPNVLKAMTNTSADSLLKQLQIENTRLSEKDAFVSHLTSMFTIQKKNGELISPERDSKWLIYIVGHGSPAFLTIGTVREQYNMIKNSITNARQALAGGARTDSNQAQQYIRQHEPKMKEYEQMLQGRSGWANTQIIPESAQIAGIPGSAFAQLMAFFDTSLDTAYVHYVTCFSGGSNQTFVNETLSALNVHFIVSTQGIQEGYTSSQLKVQVRSDKPGIQISGQDFAEFFRLLRMFFTQPEEFVTIKGKAKDPILPIIATLNSDEKAQNQPFVRFPGAGFFVATPVATDTTKTLTKTMVRAHEIEKKPIDLSDPNINVAIINTPRINVMLDLGKKGAQGHTALVTPSPASFAPGYESIHFFKEIKWQDTVQSLLFNLSYLNARLYTQTFVINTLTGVLLQQSGLPGNQNTSINNLIVQMKSVSGINGNPNQPPMQLTPLTGQALVGSTIGLNIHVAFELNGNIYQCFFAINDFERPDDLLKNMEKLAFTATPKRSMKMDALATVFLTQQDIAQVAKPVTLQSIAEYLDDKIDKQDESMAIVSEADDKALLDFISRKAPRRR